MNQSPNNETEAIRSDIDVTRRRMDDTMDALGQRLQPRHLLDEVLGFFRQGSEAGDGKMQQIREKVTHSADAAMHAVVNTVKTNPMPVLLIGAGVAWMIYESRRQRLPLGADGDYYGYNREGEELRYDPDTHFDRPLDYPPPMASGLESGLTETGGSKLGQVKEKLGEKASAATGAVKEKLSSVGQAAREGAQNLRQRAGQVGVRMKDGTVHAYSVTRERVVTTADQHPLGTGLVALAAGLIAGLALPTPPVIDRSLGPTADRLRQRTKDSGRELLEKGKRVAEAAVNAVKQEAQAQGLTPEKLREQARALGERGKQAGQEAAKQEGLGGSRTGALSTGTQPSDPTLARPAV